MLHTNENIIVRIVCRSVNKTLIQTIVAKTFATYKYYIIVLSESSQEMNQKIYLDSMIQISNDLSSMRE